jgi:two-component system nitrogen regulation sensor histidine kinase GlnL
MLELGPEAARERSVDQLLGPEHSLARLAHSVLSSGRSAAENECRVERRGEDMLVDVAASPLRDASGSLDGAVLFLRDGTLQRSLQRISIQREQLGALGEIAAGVAHEVKNPLGGIRGAAELLAARAADAKTVDAAELIVREVDRIATLVDDLMIFTQGGTVRLAPGNIHRVLDDVLDLLAMDSLGRGIELERLYDPSLPEILLDRDRMTQVFLNLARNALQAMDGSGTLRIKTRMRLDRRLTLADSSTVAAIVIEISDTGPGIPDDVLQKLGTPFFTTRAGGTGLGIAAARHWVDRHGGTLRIDSPADRGARARIELPLRQGAS